MMCLSKQQPRRLPRIVSLVVLTFAGSAVAAPPGFSPVRKVGPKPANARYVATNGSDGNPGTLARPWRTIGHAMGAAGAGQTVLVRGGTYDERVTTERSGAAGAPITLRGYPRERAVFAGSLIITSNWIQVSGLRFVRGSSSGSDDPLVYVSGGDHVEVSGNNMSGSPISAIYVGDPGNTADDVRILGNRIHDNGDDSQFHHGIYCSHTNGATIANNIVEHNAAFGIQAYPDCDNADIANNTIVANGKAGVIVGGDGETATESTQVVNNIITRNRAQGILGYWEGNTGGDNRAFGNLIASNADGSFDGEGVAVSGNILAPPRFVNLTARNYGLRRGSPAIGKAVIGLSPGRDIAGRPRGKRRDLGAVEAVPGR